ncbi:PolC-type DNA polymerase III [Companilactobacillus sp.]|jgi:DNA polymerase-3 subunit alpha (Gram-positive type)|uniref:PolC-type DNA polymerase III n=1 Tax=Companilactobacillus sp. TaxID=2767905 RepID=UPI0025B9AF9C|nr:PolC-type DNA polymerase III [Companilactobacillus sp.]MCH4008083.1 PolC-type DNA polymerase III [Companilactobacillus sp.]MCH4051738.1 PolC-type DNA polymerase III [Companilactobacillus sp.]MCH4076026.1 PolC-type DNA polymerase III [Companilactobacillus sp.]MCH4124601.1 PolC-type DNA polymerase III [Companilactobacillus sp.]MCH4132436.1 PolC-type DNA polymerase III [Companilactobacillus sp.]
MSDNQDLFKILIKQIKLENVLPNNDLFDNAKLNKVEVHKQSKRWTFFFEFNNILPFNDFQIFNEALNNGFTDIAKVDFEISVPNANLDEKLVRDYWKYVLSHAQINSPVVSQLMVQNPPHFENGQVFLSVSNSFMADFMNGEIIEGIQNEYSNLGFPAFKIRCNVDEAKSQAKLDELKASNAEKEKVFQDKAKEVSEKKAAQKSTPSSGNKLGKKIADDQPIISMIDIVEEDRNKVVEGYIFDKDVRKLKSGRSLMILKVTDYTSSFSIKKFSNGEEDEAFFENLDKGAWIRVRGNVQEDTFSRELVIMANDINIIKHETRQDTAEEGQKRIELHAHTNMSQMDAIPSATALVKRAADWGQTGIAITDHRALQAFPEAYSAGKKFGVKIAYGVEVDLVDEGNPIAYNLRDQILDGAEYVIFDTETTGLSAVYDSIIEIGATKMKNGEVIDRYDKFINPGHPLSEITTNLTSITDDMVKDAPDESVIIPEFMDFIGDDILVGHNVTFDMGFMNSALSRLGRERLSMPVIDTLEMSRTLHSEYRNHKLDSLAKRYNIVLEHHHRADSDAETTGYLMYKLFDELEEKYGTNNVSQLNDNVGGEEAYKQARPSHAILLAKTQAGLKNLFKIVSYSMTQYFYRTARVPRRMLNKYREGIIVGSACKEGEVFTTMMQKGYDETREIAQYYDYLEVMPKPVYQHFLDAKIIKDEQSLEEIISNIVKLGKEINKPVVATGDVHYLDPSDKVYRDIVIKAVKSNPLARQELPDVQFRTTNEMFDEFSFLDDDDAQEIIVDNAHQIMDSIDEMSPVKDKLYTPKMEGAEDEIKNLTLNKAHELYGNPLPEIVQERMDKELKSIIGNGFSVIYLISQRLVYKSNKDGYLVGSRGSVGSSFVATMTGITEVNPLPPHYRCPKCKYSEFYTKGEVGSGFDLADKNCPKCGTELLKDGQDIPFETFLGFKGDKVPDIDLNFSGDYQPVAHNYTKVLFGEDHVFRAGTIGTIADRTAFGYVKNYEELTGKQLRNAEEERLAMGSTGVKRTTGQHPAGIIVVPDYMDIFDFTPIQYPADDQNAAWKTTHFDFHSIHDNILKLDILGHDDPTMIRTLQDLSGIDPKTIPVDDPDVMALFSGTQSLGVTPEQIFSKTGTLGVPEFGTRFVRGMLEKTHPTTFAELLQISGLSHGTDVWLGNAEELIDQGVVTLKDVIGCRDNIMMDLIHYGMDSQMAFQIMEHVRKGRGIPDDWKQAMKDADVPDWYIKSCLKIKYMFPKAHATAYILMALRIAYFKVHYPLYYYSAYMSVRADDYDLVAMTSGKQAVKNAMQEINNKGMDASTKEKNLLTVLEIANECLERGFNIKMVDLEKSDAFEFKIIDDHTLLAPFNAIPGLGDNVAKQIVAAREEQPFLSKEDLSIRGKVSKTIIEYMSDNHVLDGMPDENQLSLF